ncbi:hypothetical protein J19TS2_38040 [Cohnella xylanilytica]|uniref:hypothetical protein n=1 Tax=Cohnella xylanilytica TaxID=557555 RepID=UPI001B1690B3|nr:hypothetical protein [Cohnella xylanilytica]GIO14249.1 hypothetical protein J19TS2_38040 [Cohnella xylanilytica]
MSSRVVLAAPEPQYAAKLARYLKENNPDWEVAAFTQEAGLLRHLKESGGGEALLVHSSLLPRLREAARDAGYRGKLIVLAEKPGATGGEGSGGGEALPELAQYQPLSRLSAELRALIEGGIGGGKRESSGIEIWTVFSASGGAGKTTVALNLAKQAGERGCRTFYLNLEPLNATDLLFGEGEPDSLSRLLYALQSGEGRAEEEWERLRRHHAGLQADYLDAPEHPAERLAMTPEKLKTLLSAIADSGSYDLIVVDPDSGCGDWHRELLAASGRIVWLTTDDAHARRKADKLLRYWQERLPGLPGRVSFVVNKHAGAWAGDGRWTLPGGGPAALLPYVPQWKTLDQPGRLFQAPAFSGAIDRLLDGFGLAAAGEEPIAARRGGSHGRGRSGAYRIG